MTLRTSKSIAPMNSKTTSQAMHQTLAARTVTSGVVASLLVTSSLSAFAQTPNAPTPQASTQAAEIMELFRALNQQGTTIAQVTHSDLNATYGTRTIELRDGWITMDTAQKAQEKVAL